MDSQPRHRPTRQAKTIANKAIMNPRIRKRKASTHEGSNRSPTTPTPSVDEDSDDARPFLLITPATKRMAPHAGLIGKELIVYADDMEIQLMAEACGVSRKKVPWQAFCSIYLRDFSAAAQLNPTVNSVKKIGDGSWHEDKFWDRLSQSLSGKVRCSGCASQSSADLLNWFFVTSSYSMAVPRL
jgi:hypothetical protein